ncbi:MAG: flagellar protein FlaG [Treponema sp.]|nr:flagellar protein FlaG [Treponema sp.]
MSVASVGFNTVSPKPLTGDLNLQAVRQIKTQPEKKVSPHIIQSKVADLQKMGNAFNKKLQFVVDHKSNDVIVKVIDKETDKVIKELPPKELQRLHSNLKEIIGLLFNEMV